MRKSPCYKLPSDSDCAAVFRAAARFVPQGPWTPGITVPLTLQASPTSNRITTHLLRCMSLLLAPTGHAWPGCRRPLLGAKQKSRSWATTSGFDPKRTQRLCATLVLRGVSVAGA